MYLRPCPHVSGYFWKRRLFSPFSKKYASTRSVFKSYSPVHTNTPKPGKYASSLYRACAVTNRACAVEETGAREIHFLTPSLRGKDWILSMTSMYSKTSVSPVHTNTINLRFQKSPLWRAFSKASVFSDRKRCIRVDRRLKRRKKFPFSKISGYVLTGPKPLIAFLEKNINRNINESIFSYK